MRFAATTIAAGVATGLMTTAAWAGPQHWAEAGAWDIFVNPDAHHACYAERRFDNGDVVRFGTVPERKGGFFAVYNAEWTDIEDGAEKMLILDFGDAKFGGDVVGRIDGDLYGGYAFFDNPEFTNEFAKRVSVTVWARDGQRRVEISLAGSRRAIDAALACQKEQPAPETPSQ